MEASAHSPDYLLGIPVVVPQATTLTHLCLIAKQGGAQVKLGLYSDGGGVPAHLVAATPATAMSAGPLEISVAPTPLAAGTYWIMAVYDTDASVGLDETDGSAAVVYQAQSFTDALPDTLLGPSEYFGQRFNYYLRVTP